VVFAIPFSQEIGDPRGKATGEQKLNAALYCWDRLEGRPQYTSSFWTLVWENIALTRHTKTRFNRIWDNLI